MILPKNLQIHLHILLIGAIGEEGVPIFHSSALEGPRYHSGVLEWINRSADESRNCPTNNVTFSINTEIINIFLKKSYQLVA